MEFKTAYRISEAANEIGVGRSTLYLAIKNGQLKTRKLGKRTLILGEDLRAFIRSLPNGASGQPVAQTVQL